MHLKALRWILPAFAAVCLHGAVELPSLISDHMVLQRGVPLRIWGKADPGERVTVSFRGQNSSASTDRLGRWAVYFRPTEAGGPFEITVAGKNSLTVRDVYVGDVWLASGQSNMEWPVSQSNDADKEIAAARYPGIRFIRFPHKVADYPLDNAWGSWKEVAPESVGPNSAVAYFFARELHSHLKVPIGIIQSAWGGTSAEAWTSAPALAADPSLMPIQADWARALDSYHAEAAAFNREFAEWEKAAAAAKAGGKEPPPRPREPVGPNHPSHPSGLYNAMIAPLTPYAIRGVIWYQGENNAGLPRRAELYRRLFPALIEDWRRDWGQGDIPFLFVQLANFKTQEGTAWPELREAQLLTLKLRNTAMAVTTDIGNPDDIHPRNKQDVGHRLALAARAVSYGEKLVYSGPLYRQMTRESNRIRLWFDHAGGGLVAKGGDLRGFTIAGADRKFVPAEARIEDNTIVVSGPANMEPAAVRYAWADNPDGNLYNSEGLPASPFRTDAPR